MRKASPHPLTVPALLFLTTPLGAVELPDLVGDWTLAEMESPTGLRETFYNTDTDAVRTTADSQGFAQENEILIDAAYPDPTVTLTRSFSISGSGAVTGGETGQILSISDNRIFYADGAELTTVYSNTTGDILLTSSRTTDLQDQTLCLKRPASLTTAELAGNWQVFSMINPRDITAIIDEGQLADTYFVSEASAVGGPITIQSNGSFSGLFSGTITATGPGDATVSTGGNTLFFKGNASKNLAYATTGDANESEYILLIRKPDTLATSELEGTWRISTVQLPTSLTEGYTNINTFAGRQADSSESPGTNEILTDVFHTDRFELNRLQIQVDSGGTFTGSISGSLAASGNQVSVTLDGETFPLQPNADKTFMGGIRVYDDSHELICCVKMSDTPAASFEEETDLQPVRTTDSLILSWNSGNNVGLQSFDPAGGWSTLEEAGGTDAFAVDLNAGGTRLFRLTEQGE